MECDQYLVTYIISNFQKQSQPQRHWALAVCTSVYLISLTPCTSTTNRMVLPPTHNKLEVCKKISHLKFMYASIQVSNILALTVCCKLINFTFQIFLPLTYEISSSFMSYIDQIIYINLAWIL